MKIARKRAMPRKTQGAIAARAVFQTWPITAFFFYLQSTPRGAQINFRPSHRIHIQGVHCSAMNFDRNLSVKTASMLLIERDTLEFSAQPELKRDKGRWLRALPANKTSPSSGFGLAGEKKRNKCRREGQGGDGSKHTRKNNGKRARISVSAPRTVSNKSNIGVTRSQIGFLCAQLARWQSGRQREWTRKTFTSLWTIGNAPSPNLWRL